MKRLVALAFPLLLAWGTSAQAIVIVADPEAEEPSRREGSGTPAEKPAAAPAEPRPPAEHVSGIVEVEATASKAEVTIGESFTVDVAVAAPDGTRLEFPPEITAEGYELRPWVAPSPSPGVAPEAIPANIRRYQAAVFQLGEASVGPVTVKYQLPDGTVGEASSEALTLKVKSLLPKDTEEQKLADIKGPFSLGIGTAFWGALGVLALLLAALVVYLLRRRGRPAFLPARVVPAVDPATEARLALEALVRSGELARADYRSFYIALSAIAKRYLERRLEAPVMEMTTAEMVAFLRQSEKGTGLATPMRDLANAADQIKFAKGVGQEAEAERHIGAVRSLIAILEERFAPPPTQEKVA